MPFVLGGDHSLSLPTLRTLGERFGADGYAVVHFDTHADTAAELYGVRVSHGTPFRVAVEDGPPARRQHRPGRAARARGPGRRTSTGCARRASAGTRWTRSRQRGLDRVLDDTVAHARGRAERVYLTVDIDVLDPAFAPGTGTPEPGGLTTRELRGALRRVAGELELCAADVVEVCPPFDPSGITALAAERIVIDVLTGHGGAPDRHEARRDARCWCCRGRDVESLLDPRELIDALATAMADLSAGPRVDAQPRRRDGRRSTAGCSPRCPATCRRSARSTAKLVTLFPGNADGPLPTHQALLGAFDPATGEPVAVMDAHRDHGAAHRRRARRSPRGCSRGADARVLAIVGTGVQARAHARRGHARARVRRAARRRAQRGARRRRSPRELRAAGPAGARGAHRPRRPSAAPTSCARRRTRSSRSSGASGSRRAPTSRRSATTRRGASSTTPPSRTRWWSSSRARPRSRRRRPAPTTSRSRSATA